LYIRARIQVQTNTLSIAQGITQLHWFQSALLRTGTDSCNVLTMDNISIKRWTKICLRTLHLLAVVGVGGGILFELEKGFWINYWWLALSSGALMMLMDMISNRVWLLQIRGLAILLKLILLAILGVYSAWDSYILIAIIIISAIISHAPGKLRYYSVYHNKIIISDLDTKG